MAYLPGKMTLRKEFVWNDSFWTPDVLGASLALWLDAADTDTITLNSSTVSQWDDKSGNGRDAVQATAAAQPTYDATGFNGKPALVWPSIANPVRIDTPPFEAQSFYFVLRYADGIQATWIGAFPGLITLPSSTGTTGNIGVIGNNTGGNQWLNSLTIPNGRYNGGDPVNLINRVTLPFPNSFLEASSAAPQTPVYSWQFGCDRNVSGRGWSGPISEIIATPSLLSTDNRQKLEGYLAWKWGLVANLPSGHPYKIKPPVK